MAKSGRQRRVRKVRKKRRPDSSSAQMPVRKAHTPAAGSSSVRRTPVPRTPTPGRGAAPSPRTGSQRQPQRTMVIRQAVGPTYSRGMSLTMKFSLLVSGLVVLVAVAQGLSASIITRSALMEQIYLQGSNAVKLLAVAGTQVIQRYEERQQQEEGENIRPPSVDLGMFRGDVVTDVVDASVYVEQSGQLKYVFSLADVRQVSNVNSISASWIDRDLTLETVTAAYGDRREPCVRFKYPVKNTRQPATAMLLLSSRGVGEKLNGIVARLALVGIVFVLFGVGFSFLLANMVTQPIKQLASDMVVVARGSLDHMTRVQSGDEIGLLASSFNHMVASLRAAQEMERESERIQSELDTAREIQANLLPEKIPEIPGYDFRAYYHSAKEVGGDYYDIFPLDYDHVALVVADVSGKGIPGSMEMARTRTILRIVAPTSPSAASAVIQTNSHLAKVIKRGMFVTLYYAVLEIPTRKLTCCSAGHNAMYIHRAANGQVEALNPNGIALGFDPGPIFERTLQEKTIQLYPGDRFILYTDGVVEAMSPSHEEFGDDRLINIIRANPNATSRDLVNIVTRAVAQHQGDAEQHDDITIVTGRILQ